LQLHSHPAGPNRHGSGVTQHGFICDSFECTQRQPSNVHILQVQGGTGSCVTQRVFAEPVLNTLFLQVQGGTGSGVTQRMFARQQRSQAAPELPELQALGLDHDTGKKSDAGGICF